MENKLAIRQAEVGFAIPPDIVLQNAMVAAKALKDVISKKEKPVIINGEQYLEYEDLQTLGQFYGYTVKTGDAVFVEIDGVKGAKAHADLVDFKTGEIIGGAEAYCMRDEERWGTRPKYEWQGEGEDRKRVKIGDEIVPWFQLASMAQTRAGAKAFRNRLAWVVVLAGYRPTPAEEMTENTVSEAVKERRTVDKSTHWCEVHGVNFFKKGRMKGYAHPIEGTDEWCNEPDEPPNQPSPGIRADMQAMVDKADKPPAETKPDAPVASPAPNLTASGDKQVETVVPGIDMDGVKDLQRRMGYDNGGFIGWMKAKNFLPKAGKVMTPEEALKSMDSIRRVSCITAFQQWVEAAGK